MKQSRSRTADGAADEPAKAQRTLARREEGDGARPSSASIDRSVVAAVRWVRAGGPSWRCGKHSVYRLPWYLVVGEAGVGKTSMLRVSGLRPGQRDVGAKGACDADLPRWWYGDDAVLFETTIGDASDDAHWTPLLRRLARARPRCPLNGIVVLVAADSMMRDDETARERRSDALRTRIAQVYRACRRRVPVYLLVTHADRLAGFDAFVGDMSEAMREQPLGVTVPLNGTAADGAPAGRLAQAFDALAHGAMAQVIARLPVRADPRHAAMAYRFPRSLAGLAGHLRRFVSEVFEASPAQEEPILLRAVYLSGVLGGGGADDTTAADHPHRQEDTVGQRREWACFGARFLREVVFGERNLVRSHHALSRRRAVLLGIAAASTVVVAACVGLGLVTAYLRGSAAVAATAPAATALVRSAQRGVDTLDPRAMLALLDAAHDLPCGQAWRDSSDGWLAALELVREMHLESACRAAYRTALLDTVQPYVTSRMAQTLADPGVSPSVRYATLRAYVMLGERSHYDRATVVAWVETHATNPDFSASERAAWVAHAASWADSALSGSPPPLDASLVAGARAQVLARPAAERVFERILPELRKAMPDPLSVADMAGPGAALVFYRKSAQPLSDGVPGAFTVAGMRRYIALRDAAVAQALADAWVLGPSAVLRTRTLTDEIDRLYFARYIAAWDAIIDDIGLRPLPSSGDGVSMIELLASRESPLRALLLRAAAETTLDEAQTRPQAAALSAAAPLRLAGLTWSRWFAAPSSAAAARDPRDRTFAAPSAIEVDRHFDALHRMVQSTSAGAPQENALDRAGAQLKEVAVYLKAAELARASALPPPPDDALARLARNAAALPAPLGDMLAGLAQDGASAARNEERARIDARWRADVAPFCHAAIDGRYPFAADASVDVTLDDFTRLFAPGGMLDTFFQANLKSYVDTTTTPWTWRPGARTPEIPAAALSAFEHAARIREAFFPMQGKTVDVRFALTPRRVDAGAARITFAWGGQTMTYAGGPPPTAAFKWPERTAQATVRLDATSSLDALDQSVEANGAWALFRWLDRGRLMQRTPDRFALTYAIGGREIELELAASSVINPFDAANWRAFRCPSGL